MVVGHSCDRPSVLYNSYSKEHPGTQNESVIFYNRRCQILPLQSKQFLAVAHAVTTGEAEGLK